MCNKCNTKDPSRQPRCKAEFVDHCDLILDPWHKEAFPDELKHASPSKNGPRRRLWACIDWCGNIIGMCGLDLGPFEDLEDVE